MTDAAEAALLKAIASGNERAFEQAYDLYHERVRVMSWRIVRRGDWLDEIVNESWSRAFAGRTSYNPERPFLVWMAGILHNVYREHVRASPTTIGLPTGDEDSTGRGETDGQNPEVIAGEAELLLALNDCFSRLSPEDARIVRLRFFENMTLRSIAKEVALPESTLREQRLPAALEQLRRCLKAKGVDFSQLFSAQTAGHSQLEGEA